MSQALYRKWRPRLWEQVIGQEHIIQTLQNAIRGGRVGHAYLFAGPRGTGKTTTARLLAKAVNCLDPDLAARPCDRCEHCQAVNEGRFLDLIEIDAASNTSVEDVRDLRDKINFAPTQGRFKVYIIDEVHMLSTAAFNALLKTLEEPPQHAIFILATTEVHKIPATVLSRCQRHEFRRIPVNEIVRHLQQLADQEGMQVDAEALTLIARQSTGAMRDAISLLDQLSSTGERITLDTAQRVLGTATNQLVIELIDSILNDNAAGGLECIHRALDSGTDPRQFARQTVEYLRGLLLILLNNADQVDATAEIRAQMGRHAAAFSQARLLNTIRLFNNAASDLRGSWQPGLPLELALAESLEQPAQQPAFSSTAPLTAPTTHTSAAAAATHPAAGASQHIPPAAPAVSKSMPAEPDTKAAQPVESAAETPQPAASTPGAGVTLQEVKQNWRRVRDMIKEKSKPTEALLNSCKPVAVRNGKLVLGFSGEVLKKKMETQENLNLTAQALSQVLGKPVGVICTVTTGKGGSDPTDLDVESDGMVGTALNLGGQIVHKE